jgi:hypothetical protein
MTDSRMFFGHLEVLRDLGECYVRLYKNATVFFGDFREFISSNAYVGRVFIQSKGSIRPAA